LNVTKRKVIIKDNKIVKCSNLNCAAYFTVNSKEVSNEHEHFCDNCKIEALHSHLVQCENCQSIINFIPLMESEIAIIYYVKKCSNCLGTIKDEKQIIPNYFPDSYI